MLHPSSLLHRPSGTLKSLNSSVSMESNIQGELSRRFKDISRGISTALVLQSRCLMKNIMPYVILGEMETAFFDASCFYILYVLVHEELVLRSRDQSMSDYSE
ncbi:hypothetical protein Fmac_008078 [Flemingia macrophylla]|uniref:Uncharacterized protein n=1 Tax=Flemingia macrophylla TaxID=520843 RepID=A0ABD1MWF3_9FABA